MSTQLLERPDIDSVTQTETKDEPEIYHCSCHCYGGLTAWCGAKLEEDDSDDHDEGDVSLLCPLCALLLEMYPDTCPKGCACDCMSRDDELWCGHHVCDDDDEEEDVD